MKYVQSLADGICSGGSLAYSYAKIWQYNASNIDISHHKFIKLECVLFLEILEHTTMLVWLALLGVCMWNTMWKTCEKCPIFTLFSHIFHTFFTGFWKSRKPESGIGTGMGKGSGTGTGNGNGTGTVMWRGTDTRTGTSFTLYYFNSDSIDTKKKKTSLVSCSPWLSLYYGNEKVKKAASKISKATALRVHRAFCQFLHHPCTTTM